MHADTRNAWYLFFFFAVVYLLLQGTKPGYTVDANATFRLTAELVHNGAISREVRAKQGIFQAIGFVPFYAIGDMFAQFHPDENPNEIRRRALCWMNGLLSAITCAVLYLLCREFGAGICSSRNVVLAAGLSTMMLPYARYDYNKVPAALLLCLLLFSVLRICRYGKSRDFFLFGLWAGLLAGVRIELLIVLPGLVAFIVYRRRTDLVVSKIVPGAAVALGLIAFVFWYQWSRWRGISGYEGGFNYLPITGMYGFLFSLGKSMFLYNPILVLLPVVFWKYRPTDCFPLWILAVGPAFVLYSWWSNWWGGWAWGPRHLVPIIPLLTIPLAVALTRTRSALFRFSFWYLAALGIAIQLLGISIDFNDGINTLFEQGATEPMVIYLWPFGGIANHVRLLSRIPFSICDFGIMRYFLYHPSTRVLALITGAVLVAILSLLRLRTWNEKARA